MTQLKINHSNLTALGEGGQYWQELKQAIASTSGYKRWIVERHGEVQTQDSPDKLVKLYLRQTLETLAY